MGVLVLFLVLAGQIDLDHLPEVKPWKDAPKGIIDSAVVKKPVVVGKGNNNGLINPLPKNHPIYEEQNLEKYRKDMKWYLQQRGKLSGPISKKIDNAGRKELEEMAQRLVIGAYHRRKQADRKPAYYYYRKPIRPYTVPVGGYPGYGMMPHITRPYGRMK